MMQSDWSTTAIFPLVNSKDERFHNSIFFKMTVQHQNAEEVQIPPQFVEHLKEETFLSAILKGPSGTYWHVKMCREAQGIYLQDGWREFQMDNSIELEDLLFFRYIGNLLFEIDVFDKNGFEKVKSSKPVQIEGTRDMPIPLTVLEAAPAGVKKRGRPPKSNVGITFRSPFAAKNRGRQLKRLEAFSFGKDSVGNELQREEAGTSTFPAFEGTRSREHPTGSSHGKGNGRDVIQTEHNARGDLNRETYVPGRVASERVAVNDESRANNRQTAQDMENAKRTKTQLETTARPPTQSGAFSFFKEMAGSELRREAVGPLTFQASTGSHSRENLKGISNMHQLSPYNYVPGAMLPLRSSDDPNKVNREGTSAGRDVSGSDKEKEKEFEARKSGSLPAVQTPEEAAIRKA